MNTKTLKLKNNHCVATFSSIGPVCGYIRVEGWISAPDRNEGFDFSSLVAIALHSVDSRFDFNCIGGFCMEEQGPVSFPFSFDVSPSWHHKYIRPETLDELTERITKSIRKVQRIGIVPTGLA